MILENDPRGAAKSGANSGKLDQDIRAVPIFLDHALDRLKMAYRSGEPVCHSLALRMTVRVVVVRMLDLLVLVDIFKRLMVMAVNYSVAMIVIIAVIRSMHIISPPEFDNKYII